MAPSSIRTTARACFLVALLCLVVANRAALRAWVGLWAFGGHEYGFAILGISAWLLWRSRGLLRETPPAPDWRGLALVVPVGIATSLAYLVDVRIAQYTLFLVSVAALTWTLLGRAVFRVVAGPMAFFLLALPVWNFFKPTLQAMTVRATALALELTGTPVFVDETYIYTPHGAVLVLEQCSGVQYFQAGVIAGALYAYLGFRSLKLRVLVLLGFVTMAITGNWVRVYALVFLGALTDLQHLLLGWGVFACLLVPTFWLSLRLQNYDSTQTSPTATTHGGQAATGSGVAGSVGQSLAGMIGILAIAVVPLTLVPVTIRGSPPKARTMPRPIPFAAQPPWSGPFDAPADWLPSFEQADAQRLASYRREEREVTAYWACYLVQKQDAKVVNQLNKVYDPARWRVRGGYAGTDYRQLLFPDRAALPIVETRLENLQTGAERLAWHWYRVAGEDVAQPLRAKLVQLLGRLKGRQDASAVVISTQGRDVDAARLTLWSFVASNRKAIEGACQPIAPQ